MQKMNFKMRNVVAIAICLAGVTMLSSCGGRSGSSGKKLASNEFLGDLPNLIYQKHLSDSIFEADMKAEADKLGKSEKDFEKAMKLHEEYKLREKEEDTKYENEIEKIKPALLGKEIPVEVEAGSGYEITSCKISDVNSNSIFAEFELKITDINVAPFPRYGNILAVTVQTIDKNGNQIGSDGAYSVELADRANGATGKAKIYITIRPSDAKQHVDFAKVKFINKK